MKRLPLAVLAALAAIAVLGASAVSAPPPTVGDNGDFNASCAFSHSAPDDPIVFPGQPGASHLHDFFGNRSTNAFSTNESLVANADTTCARQGEVNFNPPGPNPTSARSGYWVPALYENGAKVNPLRITADYEVLLREFAQVVPFPPGFRMVFGSASGGTQHAPVQNGVKIFEWGCRAGGGTRRSSSGALPPICNQPELFLDVRAPDCWDGVHLDSPDHKSHLAYSYRPPGPDEYRHCPTTHPVLVPALRLRVFYPTRAAGTITLASGAVGSTEHGDFMNGWVQERLEFLVANCTNKNIYCGFGWQSTG